MLGCAKKHTSNILLVRVSQNYELLDSQKRGILFLFAKTADYKKSGIEVYSSNAIFVILWAMDISPHSSFTFSFPRRRNRRDDQQPLIRPMVCSTFTTRWLRRSMLSITAATCSAVILAVSPGNPHEVDIFTKGFRDHAERVCLLRIRINHNLQHHPWVISGAAALFVSVVEWEPGSGSTQLYLRPAPYDFPI